MRHLALFSMGLIVSGIALAQGSVTFENLPEGRAVGGQVSGLTFVNATVLQSAVSLNEDEFPPRSGVKAICDIGGPMSITFTQPVGSFSAYVTHARPVRIQGFDAFGNVVGEVASAVADNRRTPNEQLTLITEGDLSRVVIQSDAAGSSFTLDDVMTTRHVVVGPLFTVSLESITFQHSPGLPAPAFRSVQVLADSSVNISASSSAAWLLVTPSLGRTPLELKVSVNTANLATGTYSGVVNVNGPNSTTVPIGVTLRILPPPELFSTPAGLSFTYRQGGTAPTGQSLYVGLRNGSQNLDYLAMPKDDWIKVTPNSGKTGNLDQQILVTVDASKLAPGKYQSGINIYADPTTNSPMLIPVALEVLPRSAAQVGGTGEIEVGDGK